MNRSLRRAGAIKTALIFLNGDLREPEAVRAAARRADVLICADGGARHAVVLLLEPDYIVGDMDSLPQSLPKTWKKTRYRRDSDPERSDPDKALDFSRALGVREVLVAGVRGGGIDHELVNFATLEQAKGLDIRVIDGGSARLFGLGRHRLALKKGERFSLLAAPHARLSLRGALFGLANEALQRGSRGLGNRALGLVTMTIREGGVWMLRNSEESGERLFNL